MAPPIKLVVSVDTEEDNWLPARRGITTRNAAELPKLAALFRRLGVRSTYFVTYQVARSPDAAAVLREVWAGGDAEIGAHLHPWNTPPRSGLEERVSMLKNYPAQWQEAKLGHLMTAVASATGTSPTSFRAGRFGIGAATLGALVRRGLLVDSSVTPFISWKDYDDGPCFLDASCNVYEVDESSGVCRPKEGGAITEVPISVGYTRFHWRAWGDIARLLNTRAARRLRLGGLAASTGFFSRVILSPETNTVSEMMQLSRRLVATRASHLHLFFHSSSLLPGLSPFVATERDVSRFYDAIERYVEELAKIAEISFLTVSEAARACAPSESGARVIA
jgi:hypothetical protein